MKTNMDTNLLSACALTAALVADEHLQLDVQNSLAVAQAATLAVNRSKSALQYEVRNFQSATFNNFN